MSTTNQSKPVTVKRLLISAMLSVLPFSAQAESSYGLVDIYKMAVDKDPSLAQSEFQFQADQSSLKALKGSLYPEISANSRYTHFDPASSTSNYDKTEMSLTLKQSIYQHDVWSGLDKSNSALEISKLSVDIAKQALILSSAQAYFKVLLAQQNLELLQTKEKSDLTQLESAKASEEVGLASRVDVLQAQSSYDLSRSDRISAENSLDIAQEELAKLIGSRIDVKKLNYLAMDSQIPLETRSVESVQEEAAAGNLQVVQSKAQLEVSLKEIEVQKAGFWPSFSLQATLADTQYSGLNPTDEGTSSSIWLNMSLPLYSGGSTVANVDSASYQKEVSSEQLRGAIDTAKLDARTQWRNIEQGKNLIAALREAVKSNDAFLEAAEEGYKVGLKDLLEVLSARANQVQARKNLIEAMHNQVLGLLNLEAVLGDLTIEDLQRYDTLLKSQL